MIAIASLPLLEIHMTPDKGRGLFAAAAISCGTPLVEMKGTLYSVDELPEDGMAMQVGDDLWLHSAGELVDDCGNHSCAPNAGFLTGEPVLYALRDIAVGEEITWDYSTSMGIDEWSLECRCGAVACRGTVVSWHELAAADRERLRGIALAYLRAKDV